MGRHIPAGVVVRDRAVWPDTGAEPGTVVGNTYPDKQTNAQTSSSTAFETDSSHPLSLQPCLQGRQVSAAPGKTPLITHPSHLRPATPNSSSTPASQIPRRAEQRQTDRPEGVCAIHHGQERGTRDDAWHSSALPFRVQALPPSRGEVLLWWEQLCKQQGPSSAIGII